MFFRPACASDDCVFARINRDTAASAAAPTPAGAKLGHTELVFKLSDATVKDIAAGVVVSFACVL